MPVQPEVSPSLDIPLAVTPEALGAGVGQAIQGIGDTASDIHFAAVEHANQTAVLAADNSVEEATQQGLYDAKSGVLNQRAGRNAPALVDDALAKYDDHVAKVAGGLANDRQKAQFAQLAQQRRFHVEHELAQYEHAETTRDANETDDASIALQQNRAVLNATNPEQVYNAVDHIKAVIADAGVRNGQSDATTKDLQAKAASQTYLATLNQLVSTGQDAQAKDLFEANRDQFTGPDLNAATRLVEAGSTAGESQRISQEMVRKPDGSFRTRAEVQDLIDQDKELAKNPKLLDAVQNRTDDAFARHDRAQNEAEGQQVTDLYNVGKTSPLGAYDPKVIAGMATMPYERQQQLQNALRREAPAFSAQYYDLRRLVGTEAFLHTDLTKYIGTVRDQDLHDLAGLQQEQAAKGLTGPKITAALTDNDIVNTTLTQLGMTDAEEKGSDAANQLRKKYDLLHQQAVAANHGQPISDDDKTAIGKALRADYITTVQRSWANPARWFGSATTTGSAGPLYAQPDDIVARNAPVPGTYSERTGEALTTADVQGWVRDLAPGSPTRASAIEHLKRLKQGLSADGSFDPAAAQRYQVILDAYDAAQGKP